MHAPRFRKQRGELPCLAVQKCLVSKRCTFWWGSQTCMSLSHSIYHARLYRCHTHAARLGRRVLEGAWSPAAAGCGSGGPSVAPPAAAQTAPGHGRPGWCASGSQPQVLRFRFSLSYATLIKPGNFALLMMANQSAAWSLQGIRAAQYCVDGGCSRQALYNYEGEPPLYCSDHKDPVMVPQTLTPTWCPKP